MTTVALLFAFAGILVWFLAGLGVVPARIRPLELGAALLAVALVLIPGVTVLA